MRLAQPQRGRKPRFVVLGEPISGNTRYYGSLTVIPLLSSALCVFFIFFFVGDQTCQSHANDSVRDWQWFGLDGITQDNGHGLMDEMPISGTTLGGYRRDQPLPIALSRQPVGSIDVFINEGLLCVCNFF